MKHKFAKIHPLLLWGGVLVACILFWTQFFGASDWVWTTQQPEFWWAVGESVVFLFVYMLLLWLPFPKNWMRYGTVAVLFLIIAFLHAFFWAVLVVALYGAMLYLTGRTLLLFYRKNQDLQKPDFHLCIGFGICGVLCLVAVASVLKIGTPEKLRPIFLVVFALELLLHGKWIAEKVRSMVPHLNAVPVKLQKTDLVVSALILCAVTIFVCRANMCLDYDSQWYGLRSEYVLAPATGIYDKLTMMACVYTYSKGIEILALPFAGLETYSYTIGLNLLFAALALHVMYRIGKQTMSESKSRMLVMLVALTPAIMLQSNTAKSDMSTFYLMVMAIYFATISIKENVHVYASASIAILLLSYAFKSTALLFSTLLIVILAVLFFKYRIWPKKNGLSLCVFPLVALIVVLARTVLLTGYPFNALVVSFLEGLGYYPNYPYTFPTTRTTSMAELFTTDLFWKRFLRLFKLFFFPNTSDLMTLEISWWGPLFSVLWFCAALYFLVHIRKVVDRSKKSSEYLLSTVLFVVISLVSGGCMMLLETPDGNYFTLLFAVTYWFLLISWDETGSVGTSCVKLAIMPLIACNLVLSVLISPSWSVGFTPISLEFQGYYNHKNYRAVPIMEHFGLYDLYEYFDSTPEPQRVISIVYGHEQEMFLLPASLELYNHQKLWGGNTCDTYDNFLQFIEYAEVDSFLVERKALQEDEQVYSYLVEMADEGMLKLEKEVGDYAILLISGLPDADAGAIEYLESVSTMAE